MRRIKDVATDATEITSLGLPEERLNPQINSKFCKRCVQVYLGEMQGTLWGIFTLCWFSLEAWMFFMCGHWSGGVYLLGLVMPEASLSVLLARALEVRAVDCDKERRENE